MTSHLRALALRALQVEEPANGLDDAIRAVRSECATHESTAALMEQVAAPSDTGSLPHSVSALPPSAVWRLCCVHVLLLQQDAPTQAVIDRLVEHMARVAQHRCNLLLWFAWALLEVGVYLCAGLCLSVPVCGGAVKERCTHAHM